MDKSEGNPSEKFLEEKLKLNQVVTNMRKIEQAIPMLNEIYATQGKQADTLLLHKMQMKELITYEELATKLSAFGLDVDAKLIKRIKLFQTSIQ